MSVIVDMSIFPLDKGVELSIYVARAVRVIRDSGLPYVLGPMSTAMEGEWSQVMAVVDRCMQELKSDCERVYLSLTVDYRKGRQDGLKNKVRSVETQLMES